jgi:hypothetical protein
MMLGEAVSFLVVAICLIGAVGALGYFVYYRRKSNSSEAALSARLAAYFLATAVLCGIALVGGVATYSVVDSSNLPTRAAVAIGFLCVPVAAGGVVWIYYLRKGK